MDLEKTFKQGPWWHYPFFKKWGLYLFWRLFVPYWFLENLFTYNKTDFDKKVLWDFAITEADFKSGRWYELRK